MNYFNRALSRAFTQVTGTGGGCGKQQSFCKVLPSRVQSTCKGVASFVSPTVYLFMRLSESAFWVFLLDKKQDT